MTDAADDLRDFEEEMELLKFFHDTGKCEGYPLCPFCYAEHEKLTDTAAGS